MMSKIDLKYHCPVMSLHVTAYLQSQDNSARGVGGKGVRGVRYELVGQSTPKSIQLWEYTEEILR